MPLVHMSCSEALLHVLMLSVLTEVTAEQALQELQQAGSNHC